VDDVDHDGDLDAAGVGLGVDAVELVGVAVHQHDPVSAVVGVAAGGLVEPGCDHGCGVVGDTGAKPLASRDRRRPGVGALGVAVGQDVGDRAGCGGQVVDAGELGHALAVALLALGQAA
jgi:hypothetical protein